MDPKLAFAAVSALSSVGQAMSTASNARSQVASTRGQVELERQISETRAAQDSARRTRRLGEALSSQTALMAARQVDFQTFDGVRTGDRQVYDEDIRNIGLNKTTKLLQLDYYQADVERQAASATRSAFLNAGSNVGMLGFQVARGWGATPPAPKPSAGGVSRSAYMAGYTGAG